MSRIIKYNLELMSCILAIIIAVGVMNWGGLSLSRRMTLIFDNMVVFALVPLVLALFEGFIHTAGIVIHQIKRPYSPGMITAWIMFVYAIIMIPRLNAELELVALE